MRSVPAALPGGIRVRDERAKAALSDIGAAMKMMCKILPSAFAGAVCLIAAGMVHAQAERKVTRLTEGIYEIEHRQGAGGNTTVIIGDRQVLVVDSCFLPSAAREDISDIRKWTDKPVTFVLNTHFHNDHNFGNRTYLDAFRGVTIVAQTETRKEMDRFGPGSLQREEKDSYGIEKLLEKMLETGMTQDGRALGEEDKTEVKRMLAERPKILGELRGSPFQGATMSFDQGFSVDLGHREVEIRFLGRGNTPGDAVAYLPKEKILVAGDLVDYPLPNVLDGYPSEWTVTLDRMAQLEADTIVPGHGPVLHDKAYVYLLRDLLRSAVDQVGEQLRRTAPAMFLKVEDVRGSVDLSGFRPRFAGQDQELGAAFDEMAQRLVKLAFDEARLR